MIRKSRIRKVLAAAALVSFSAPLQAATFSIELTVTSGDQSGQPWAGPFYDEFDLPTFTGVGPEVFVGDGSKDGPIVGFSVPITADVEGTLTTITFEDDDDPSLFEITFNDGVFLGIDFLSEVFDPFDLGIGDTWASTRFSNGSNIYTGTFEITMVPVPAALPLMAGALGVLAGAGAWRRRIARGRA